MYSIIKIIKFFLLVLETTIILLPVEDRQTFIFCLSSFLFSSSNFRYLDDVEDLKSAHLQSIHRKFKRNGNLCGYKCTLHYKKISFKTAIAAYVLSVENEVLNWHAKLPRVNLCIHQVRIFIDKTAKVIWHTLITDKISVFHYKSAFLKQHHSNFLYF